MFGKKTLRLAIAALLVGVALGAQQVSGATARHARAAGESGVISITDWEFPSGCNLLNASAEASVEGCAAETFDSILGLDNHLTYFPDLAENIPTKQNGEVKMANGNLVVTYKLKPNLKWSDGSPLTVDDFIFSVPIDIAGGDGTGIDQIKSMQKIDPLAVQVTYNGIFGAYVAYGWPRELFPKAYLETKYGTTNAKTIISKILTDNYNSPSDVFSGPYKVESWINGQSVVLVPNPYYSALPQGGGYPRAAQIKFVTVTSDEQVLAQDLRSAKAGVDGAEDFQITDLPTLYGAKNYQLAVIPGLTIEHLELNESGALKDVRLRRALQYAINKVAFIHALFPQLKNATSILEHTVIPVVDSPWYDKSLPLSAYNPARAKALLKAAGYSTSYYGPGKHLTLRFATTPASTRVREFNILQRMWAAVGVHLKEQLAPCAVGCKGGMFESWQNNGVLYHGRYDIALFAYSETPDPQTYESLFDPKQIPGPSNTTGGNNSHVTDKDQIALLRSAGKTLDTAQRIAIINRWQKLVNNRVYWIPLYNRPAISLSDGTIGNWKPNPSSASNEWNAFQWYKTSGYKAAL